MVGRKDKDKWTNKPFNLQLSVSDTNAMNFQSTSTRQAIRYQSHDIEEAKSQHWAIKLQHPRLEVATFETIA
ncbi:hypothetical protein PVK06_031290 [Gossypium arboreum]|uniref:Uncharacterized protein n=1 Tax=Gossypium arboreum TaxID=29729 RepID=A0ABR0NQL2_GOSAR|nr:hypothetical protein PVK06_031290 [Gossypium arboreum]